MFRKTFLKHNFHAHDEHGTVLWKFQNQTLLKLQFNDCHKGRFLNGFKCQRNDFSEEC